MPKGGKSSGDYEGWLLRTIDRPEDLAYARDASDWHDFMASKTQDYHGMGVSGGQTDAIAGTLRDLALDLQKDTGFEVSEQRGRQSLLPIAGAGGIRFRDMTGEFGRKGTWVSADKVRGRIMDELDARVQSAKAARRGY